MAGKIRLRIGPVEIECEGEIGASNADILALAEAAAELYKRQGLAEVGPIATDPNTAPERIRIQGSAASIASRLNCISGPELMIAAAAWLTFVNGEEWFATSRLLEEMKKAAAHFDHSYQSTLADDVRGLVRSGKLVEVSKDLFALSATMRRHLQRALAE